MLKVTPKGSKETSRSMLKRLRKLCERDGLLKELKRRAYYEKPSDRKRREKRQAERRAKQSLINQKQDKKRKKKELQRPDEFTYPSELA